MRRLLIPLFCVAAAGCATMSGGRFERSAENVVALINAGAAEELTAMSGVPFLLDGELVVLDQDVATFWDGVAKAGFHIDAAAVEAQPLEPDSFSRFADTMDVRTFFEKYVSDRGSIVVLHSGGTRILLLMDRGKRGRTLIVGFKGPDPV